MKKLTLGLLLISSLSTQAWQIVHEDDIFVLKKNGIQIEVESSGGMPKYLREVKLTKQISYFVYYSGTAGTSHPINIDRAVIYDFSKKKTLGDFPYRYKSSKGAKLDQPTWVYNGENKTLKIVDSESSTNRLIYLK